MKIQMIEKTRWFAILLMLGFASCSLGTNAEDRDYPAGGRGTLIGDPMETFHFQIGSVGSCQHESDIVYLRACVEVFSFIYPEFGINTCLVADQNGQPQTKELELSLTQGFSTDINCEFYPRRPADYFQLELSKNCDGDFLAEFMTCAGERTFVPKARDGGSESRNVIFENPTFEYGENLLHAKGYKLRFLGGFTNHNPWVSSPSEANDVPNVQP